MNNMNENLIWLKREFLVTNDVTALIPFYDVLEVPHFFNFFV